VQFVGDELVYLNVSAIL